jgi:hypothetical protein
MDRGDAYFYLWIVRKCLRASCPVASREIKISVPMHREIGEGPDASGALSDKNIVRVLHLYSFFPDTNNLTFDILVLADVPCLPRRLGR